MPSLKIDDHSVSLDGMTLRSGDLIEVLGAGRRWIQGMFWMPGDHPVSPHWHDGDGLGPCLRVPLAVPSEEDATIRDAWPDDDADFRPYATLYLRDGCVARWIDPRRNLYLGPRRAINTA